MNATKFARECGLIGEPHRCDYTCDCEEWYELPAPEPPDRCGKSVGFSIVVVASSALGCGIIFAAAWVWQWVTG